jgi:hypothetical protein
MAMLRGLDTSEASVALATRVARALRCDSEGIYNPKRFMFGSCHFLTWRSGAAKYASVRLVENDRAKLYLLVVALNPHEDDHIRLDELVLALVRLRCFAAPFNLWDLSSLDSVREVWTLTDAVIGDGLSVSPRWSTGVTPTVPLVLASQMEELPIGVDCERAEDTWVALGPVARVQTEKPNCLATCSSGRCNRIWLAKCLAAVASISGSQIEVSEACDALSDDPNTPVAATLVVAEVDDTWGDLPLATFVRLGDGPFPCSVDPTLGEVFL